MMRINIWVWSVGAALGSALGYGYSGDVPRAVFGFVLTVGIGLVAAHFLKED